MTRHQCRVALLLTVGAILMGFPPVFAQPLGAEAVPRGEAQTAARAAQSVLDRVAWLQGCWQTAAAAPSEVEGPVVEEQWMAPRGGTMIGMGRTVRGGKTTEYELVVVREQDGRLAYEAHPSGQ